MTAAELATLFPRLYHVTVPGAWDSIQRLGLRPSVDLAKRQGKLEILERRRPSAIDLGNNIVLNDQLPLSEKALDSCLDDELTPRDWLGILNRRVFFYPTETEVEKLLNARINRSRERDILIFDTKKLSEDYLQNLQFCPINSGSTIRKPARRGLNTFTSITSTTYQAWRRKRGKADNVREIVSTSPISCPEKYLQARLTKADFLDQAVG